MRQFWPLLAVISGTIILAVIVSILTAQIEPKYDPKR